MKFRSLTHIAILSVMFGGLSYQNLLASTCHDDGYEDDAAPYLGSAGTGSAESENSQGAFTISISFPATAKGIAYAQEQGITIPGNISLSDCEAHNRTAKTSTFMARCSKFALVFDAEVVTNDRATSFIGSFLGIDLEGMTSDERQKTLIPHELKIVENSCPACLSGFLKPEIVQNIPGVVAAVLETQGIAEGEQERLKELFKGQFDVLRENQVR